MSFLKTFTREAKTIFSDIAIVLTIVGGVVLYSFLYPQPYASQSVSELAISVVDLDLSESSRDIIFKLNATPQIRVTRVDVSEKDAKDALLEDKIKAIIVIPPHFKRDIALHKSPTIAVGVDSSYFLIYGGVLEGAMKSILTEVATLKIVGLLQRGTPLSSAKEAYAPYSLNIINLFNPQNSYTQYVIPAVFILILQQTMLIGLGILGGGVNERQERRGATWMVMLWRVLIFGSLFFMHMLFYFGFSFEFFGVTHLASMSDLITFGIPFILATAFFGIFLGSLFSSREIATPLVLFSSLPLIFTAGFVWPLESVPEVLQLFSNLVPSTPAINGFLKLNQMGAELSMVLPQYIILWIQAVIYMFLGYYFINKKRKSYGNN
jgi:ABC-2 type transport system permease protein